MAMKRLIPILFLLLFVFVMFQSCGRGRGEYPLLSRADSLMFVRPDSSLTILEGMAVPEDEEGRAYYALLLTQARYRNYEPIEDDSLLRIALNYYGTSDDLQKRAWTLLYAGCLYADWGEKQKALAYFHESLRVAEKSGNNLLLSYIYHNLGKLLEGEMPYNQSIAYFKKSKEYAVAMKDTALIISQLQNIGWNLLYKSDYDSAEVYMLQCLDLASAGKLSNGVVRAFYDLGVIQSMKGEEESALRYLDLGVANLDSLVRSDLRLTLLRKKGAVLMQLGQLDSAAYYMDRGRETGTLYGRAYDADLRSQLAERRGDYRGALSWSRRYSSLLDSISRYENDNRVMTLEKRYNYARVEAERNALEAERQHSRVVQLLVAMACMVAAGAGIAYVRHLRRTLRERLRAKEELAASAMAQLHRRTGDLLAMEEAMSAQSSELERHRAATEQQRGELSALREEREGLLRRLYAMNATVRKVEALRNGKPGEGRRVRLDATELNDLLEAVNTGYDGFIDRLRMASPSLSDADLHLCALLRMGLSHLHISELLGCSESALRKRKSRLKTDKLGDTTSRSLEEILSQI